MTLLLLYAALAIAVSFVCSLLEACLLSLPRSYVESLVEEGSRTGRALREMKDNIDRPLAAILTLNTVAHTIGAAGVGAQAAVVFGSAAVGLVSAVMTLLILVLSEIIPKTLGSVHAKALAGPAAVTIRLMVVICLPLIIPLEWINGLIGYQRRADLPSRGELLATLRLGRQSGAMHGREYQVAANLTALRSIRVVDVLTPRTVVLSLPEEMTVRQALAENHPLRFARIPLYTDEPEQVARYTTRHAVYGAHYAGQDDKTLGELSLEMTILPDLASVGDAMEVFIRDKLHIALAVDEYGGMAGVVTLEDLVETLLGEEIVDETDAVADMRELARRRNEA